MDTYQKKGVQNGLSRWPIHGWVGLGLAALFWYLNWGLSGLRSHWAFFPLWLGYILTVDALVYFRRGHSYFSRNLLGFAVLFLLSAPFWWIFEALNARVGYWVYRPIESFNDLEYYLYCTLNFSVVLPAIFVSTQLFGTFSWLKKLGKGPVVGKKKATVVSFFILGWVLLAVTLLWPTISMAFIWMSLYFIMDPINVWLGRPSLLERTAKGDWRLVLALWLGGLLCGFFWEMWNYYSSPKWYYQIPYVDFWYVFEMPLLGYLGYLPFALELYAMYALFSRWMPGKRPLQFLQEPG